MPTIVVEVMPKAVLLDPQGKAVAGALARLGNSRFTDVRIGKRFEISFDGDADDAALAEARVLAESLFSNSVIEDVVSVRYAAEWHAYNPIAPTGDVETTSVARGELADDPTEVGA